MGGHGLITSARDVIRPVVCSGASAFVLAHNHPSGDPTPSEDDKVFTAAISQAAEVVGVPLVDHLVLGGWDRYVSFYNHGLLRFVGCS